MITIDDFKKLNIVVGTVESVEEIEGSEKLYKFTINIGAETRQVLGGLKPSYAKEELLGKQVIVLANLEPRMLMGLESQGMILCASLPAQAGDESGKPVILSPIQPAPNGSAIR